MWRYLLRRFAIAALCMFAVATIVFFVARLAGDPTILYLSDWATIDDKARVARQLGVDKPLFAQYAIFLNNAARGDLGTSIHIGRPALEVVLERFPATAELGGASILVSVLIALPIGVYSAVRRGGLLDAAGRTVAVLGQAAPAFWVGLILMFVFAVRFHVLPAAGIGGPKHLVLPAVAMGWYVVAGIMRLTRSSMLEVLGSEYVKLARAKGMPERTVIWKHAFKNAALPVLTFSMVVFVGLLAGSVVVETVFAWPGVGRLAIDAIRWRDYPVVQTVVLLISALYIAGNFLVDVLYGYLDPKIRYGGR